MERADRPWRCFVAVPIGPAVALVLEKCVADLRRRPGADDWRWTDAEAWHATLAFLGSTDPTSVPRLADALAAATATAEPFTLASGGLGTFPSRRRARVLWYGLDDRARRLRRLAQAVRAAVGLEDDERFRAHLTLARARERTGTDAAPLLAGADAPPGRVNVDRVVLYRSHLGRGPARYEALAEAPLRGGRR